jgi:hypothetical protein
MVARRRGALADGAFIVYAWTEQIPGADRAPVILMIVFIAALISSVAGFAFSALAGAGLGHLAITPTEAVGNDARVQHRV